jgi:hypothetical protein
VLSVADELIGNFRFSTLDKYQACAASRHLTAALDQCGRIDSATSLETILKERSGRKWEAGIILVHENRNLICLLLSEKRTL